MTDFHCSGNNVGILSKGVELNRIIQNLTSRNLLFIFSGDMTQCGTDFEFKKCEDFLSRFLKQNNKNIYISMCPGNHDAFYAISPSYTQKEMLQVNQSNFKESLNERLLLVDNFSNFKKRVVSNFSKNEENEINPLLCQFSINDSGEEIIVASLNNSLFCTCNDEDFSDPNLRYNESNMGNVYISPEYLEQLTNMHGKKVILNMHIPYEFFDESTKAIIDQFLEKNDVVVFSGHTHLNKGYTLKFRLESSPQNLESYFYSSATGRSRLS